MSFDVVSVVLAANLAAGGTKSLSYPAGRSKGNYKGAAGHKAQALQSDLSAPADFTLTFNSTDITFTLGSGRTTIPAGETLSVQLEHQGENDGRPVDPAAGVALAPLCYVDLGSPIAANSNAFIVAATGAELPNAATKTYTFPASNTSPLDGVNQTGDLDVPRAVSAVVTHATSIVAMTVTVTGKDKNGVTVSEALSVTATGTSKTVNGKKAFASIDSVAISSSGDATANTLNLGFIDVIGLPVALPTAGAVIKELEDGALATAGIVVAADDAKATTTTGDVRGTYDPNSACNGAKGFVLLCSLPDPAYQGVDQA